MPEKTIYSRLVAFQAKSPVTKKGEENPFYKSKYAPLDAIQEAIQKPLADNGLGYMFQPTNEGLKAIMFDEDGTTLEFVYPANLTGKPQEIGSNITYAKRYALTAMFGLIVADEDDDGNTANEQKEAKVDQITWLTKDQFDKALNSTPDQIDLVLKKYTTATHKMSKAFKTQLEAKLQQNSELPDPDKIVTAVIPNKVSYEEFIK
jgi:hypothetical protein